MSTKLLDQVQRVADIKLELLQRLTGNSNRAVTITFFDVGFHRWLCRVWSPLLLIGYGKMVLRAGSEHGEQAFELFMLPGT